MLSLVDFNEFANSEGYKEHDKDKSGHSAYASLIFFTVVRKQELPRVLAQVQLQNLSAASTPS